MAHKQPSNRQKDIPKMIRQRTGNWSAQADAIRKRLSKKKKSYSDSTALMREDRDR